MNVKKALLASLIVSTASGCGGGKAVTAPVAVVVPPAPAPAPAPPPVQTTPLTGIFNGDLPPGRKFNGVVLADGGLYGVYTAAGNAALVGGLVQGTGSSSNNMTYTSSSIKDFNAEGSGVRDASLSATYESNLRFNGTITYALASVTPLNFTSSIFDASGATAVSTMAGTYSGSYAEIPSGRSNLSVTLDGTGTWSATAANGCKITGQISAVSKANVFNVSLAFGPAPCAFQGRALSGAAVFNASARVLTGGATSGDRASAVAFILTKQ